jgi:hypothetical protein
MILDKTAILPERLQWARPHTLFSIIRLFGGTFKNLYASGVLDVNFKGGRSFAHEGAAEDLTVTFNTCDATDMQPDILRLAQMWWKK